MKNFKLVWLGIGIVVIWVGALVIPLHFVEGWAERGQLGDMFGTVNALFSGLAFAGVIVAILLQKEELGLQREELKMTREELKRSAEAQEKSEESLRKQAESLKVAAKLNAINNLLSINKEEIKNLNVQIPFSTSMKVINKSKFDRLNEEKERLINDLEGIYRGKS